MRKKVHNIIYPKFNQYLLLTFFRYVLATLSACFFYSQISFAQSADDFRKAADEAYNKGDFYTAAILYKSLYEKNNADLEIAYKYANANRFYNNYVDAEETYLKIMLLDKEKKFPLAEFYYAEMNKYNGNYTLALRNFKNYYNSNKTKNDFFTLKSLQEITSCAWAIENSDDTLSATVTHMGKNINTPFSEFGAVQMGDSMLVYSSLRRITKNDFESFLPEVYLSKIYYSWISIAGFSSAREMKARLNRDDEHTANISFDSEHHIAYFTRCNTNESGEMQCQIYSSSLKNGKWTKARKLNNLINAENSTNTQPAYVKSGDKEILYFASNRQGGFGQMDIWYSIKYKGNFSQPVNLGSRINTAGNEISPFYDARLNKLFFASDWHKGYGGFDIFESVGEQNQWSDVRNLGKPVNSTYNDMYLTLNTIDTAEGYLTSNRKGSFFIKGETCCNDIYSFKLKEQKKISDVKTDTVVIIETVRRLLPLTLYFHNDEPDAACMNVTTDKNYKNCLADYYALKEKYKSEYGRGLKNDDKQKAAEEIEYFFKNEVATGYTKLEKFAELLLQDLRKSNEIRITVKGYASPLNSDIYNINLTKRRISSLLNYLKEYKEGVFLPYLNTADSVSSRLIIYEEPLGKSMADKTVSDNPNDIRNSIYSIAAAKERKIQILYYDYTLLNEQKSASDSTPVIKFENDSVDYGKLSTKGNNAFSIRFKNAGKYPFRITNVSADCNCVKFYWKEKDIAANESEIINLLILTEGLTAKQKIKLNIKLMPYNKSVEFPIYFEAVK